MNPARRLAIRVDSEVSRSPGIKARLAAKVWKRWDFGGAASIHSFGIMWLRTRRRVSTGDFAMRARCSKRLELIPGLSGQISAG
jgi:hypothetical protein